VGRLVSGIGRVSTYLDLCCVLPGYIIVPLLMLADACVYVGQSSCVHVRLVVQMF